jgi:hypothetical protein
VQPLERFPGPGLGHEPRREALEHLLQGEQFGDLAPRRLRDEGPDAGHDLHEPFDLELLQGLAHRRAADPE